MSNIPNMPNTPNNQTAYERWELASFGDQRSSAKTAASKLTPEQIEKLREEAKREGRAAGYTAGYAEGRTAGLEAGRAEAAREAASMSQIAGSFSNEITQANEVMADDLLHLALDIAKAMLKTALDVRPELVLPIVNEAIRYLPNVQQPALLYLHPQDAALVKNYIGVELDKTGWRIVEDAHLARGGCRIDTASNQIDASPQTRWQRIAESLGKESSWLAS